MANYDPSAGGAFDPNSFDPNSPDMSVLPPPSAAAAAAQTGPSGAPRSAPAQQFEWQLDSNGIMQYVPAAAGGRAPHIPTMAEAIANPGMTGGGSYNPFPNQTGSGGVTTPSTGPRDALARMRKIFTQYGLPSNVGDWAWQQLQDGKSQDEILLDLNDPSTVGGAEYDRRFPGIQLRQKAGKSPITPANYIQYENARREVNALAGLPVGFHDSTQDTTDALVNDVSIAEYSTRIQNGYLAVKNAPADVRAEWGRLFGGDSDTALAMHMLDPAQSIPILERQVQTATAAGLGKRQGFELSYGQASALGDKGLSAGQLTQGFEQLQSLGGVFNNTGGEQAQTGFSWDKTGLDAIFNSSVQARNQIEQRVAQRQNAGRVGVGSATGNEGVYGAGWTS